MSEKHKHVIIGGGFAGLRAARLLANRDDIAVLVVNPQLNFEYHGSLYRSANGYSPLETVIPYREIFQGTDIQYQQDFMVDVDPVQKRIRLLSGQEIGYDSLTLALGYEPEYFGIPGMREFSKTLYSLADALELRKSLAHLAQTSFLKSSPARVIVAGGGPTGIEVAASITRFFELITGDSRVEINLIEAQSRILSGLSEDFAYQVERSLDDQIKIQCGKKVIRATKELLHIVDGPAQAFDILIWTAGSSANSYFRQRSDLFEVDRKGRVLVDKYLQYNYDGLYVVGDSAAVEYSGTAHAAIEMGAYVASHVISKLHGQKCAGFLPSQPEYAVPTGHETAVAMQGTKLLVGQEGWQMRREFDLRALSLIASKEVAHAHWLKGEDFSTTFTTARA